MRPAVTGSTLGIILWGIEVRKWKGPAIYWPPELVADLEKINFENQVFWHRGQLLRVMKGVPVSKVFTGTESKRLKAYGILKRKPGTFRPRMWIVTEEAISCINLKPEISGLDLKPEM